MLSPSFASMVEGARRVRDQVRQNRAARQSARRSSGS